MTRSIRAALTTTMPATAASELQGAVGIDRRPTNRLLHGPPRPQFLQIGPAIISAQVLHYPVECLLGSWDAGQRGFGEARLVRRRC